MILENIKGGELTYHMRKCKRFSVETSRYYFIQLASSIQHLNKCGYCHRDLKPWNIMMSDDLTEVKVIDFGYATPINSDTLVNDDTYSFLREKLSCTSNYMAPELYKHGIDFSLARCDVFSLGIILYNFITGEYAF